MISRLRELSPAKTRQLITLLHAVAQSSVDLSEVTDEQLAPLLVATLRRALEVPDKADADLPEYLRRRLVDLARRQFELIGDADLLTDMELAHMLVDFTLAAAEQLAADAERRKDFETFLRTKSLDERLAWLMASQRFAALIADEPFDPAIARGRARALNAERGAHEQTARVLLGDLDQALWTQWRSQSGAATSPVSHRSSVNVGAPPRADAGPELRTGASRGAPRRARPNVLAAAAAASAGAALGPALALPLGAVAGGLFMAGLRRRELIHVPDPENVRKVRARRSKLVQAVVAIAAFMVADAATNDLLTGDVGTSYR